MKRRLGIVVILALALMLTGVMAYAMPLTGGDGMISLTCTTLDGETYELSAQTINLIGRENDSYLICGGGKLLRANSGDLGMLVDSIGSALNSLPTVESYPDTLSRGARGDDVVKLQEKLIKAGYLSGSADGDFGGMTQRALSSLQSENGLEETGEADAYTQMLLDSMVQPPVVVSPKAVTGGRFENITSHSNVDLSGAVEKNLTLDYDDLSGEGLITNDNVIRYNTPTSTSATSPSSLASTCRRTTTAPSPWSPPC